MRVSMRIAARAAGATARSRGNRIVEASRTVKPTTLPNRMLIATSRNSMPLSRKEPTARPVAAPAAELNEPQRRICSGSGRFGRRVMRALPGQGPWWARAVGSRGPRDDERDVVLRRPATEPGVQLGEDDPHELVEVPLPV